MIKYSETNNNDILRIVEAGAPGYAENGTLVKVIATTDDGVRVVNKSGEEAYFMFECGAARLEKTDVTVDNWKSTKEMEVK